MRDFELNFFLNLGGHPMKLRENKAIGNFASRRLSRTKLDVCRTLCAATREFFDQNFSHSRPLVPVDPMLI